MRMGGTKADYFNEAHSQRKRADTAEAALKVMLDFADEIAAIPVDRLGKYAVAANLQEAAYRSRIVAKGKDADA